MPLADAAGPAAIPRAEAPRTPRKIPHMSPLLAALAVGAFALSDEQFSEALDQLRAELAPITILESILVAMLIEAAEMLRVASREREKIRAGDVKWTRFRNSAERSFWRALKAFHDGRKPAKAAKPAASSAAEEAPKPAPPEAARVELEKPAPTPPAPKPAPAPEPTPVAQPAEAKAEPRPRSKSEDALLSKPVWVIKNLLEATAPRPNSSYLDISILPTRGGPARTETNSKAPGLGRSKSRSR